MAAGDALKEEGCGLWLNCLDGLLDWRRWRSGWSCCRTAERRSSHAPNSSCIRRWKPTTSLNSKLASRRTIRILRSSGSGTQPVSLPRASRPKAIDNRPMPSGASPSRRCRRSSRLVCWFPTRRPIWLTSARPFVTRPIRRRGLAWRHGLPRSASIRSSRRSTASRRRRRGQICWIPFTKGAS